MASVFREVTIVHKHPTVFILFVAASIFQVVLTVCKSQRFLFCLSPYLFSEWHIVPQLCIQTKQSRVHSRKALSECKASRRLGKQIRCFYRFLSKPTMGFRYTCVVFFLSSSHKKSEKTAMKREFQRRYYASHKEELQRKILQFHRRLRVNKRL